MMEVAGERVDSPRSSREGYSEDVVYSVNVRRQGTVFRSRMAYPRNWEASGQQEAGYFKALWTWSEKELKFSGGKYTVKEARERDS